MENFSYSVDIKGKCTKQCIIINKWSNIYFHLGLYIFVMIARSYKLWFAFIFLRLWPHNLWGQL